MTLDPSIPMQGMNRPQSSLADMVSLADNIGQMQYNQQMRPMQMQEQQNVVAKQQAEAQQMQAEREQAKQYRQNFDQVTKAYVQETGKYEPMEIMNRLAQASPQTAQYYQEKLTKYGDFLAKYQKDTGEYEKIMLENKIKGMQTVGKMLDGVTNQQEYDGVVDAVAEFGLDDELSLDPRFVPQRARAIVNTVINDLDRRKVAVDEMNAQAQSMNAQTQREKLSLVEKRASEPKMKDLDAKKTVEVAKAERQTLLSTIDEVLQPSVIDEMTGKVLKEKPAGAVGLNPVAWTGWLPGTPQHVFAKKVENIRNKLTVNERGKMRGQGQISDKETAMLERAVSILSTSVDKKTFVEELNRLRQGILEMEKLDSQIYSGQAQPEPEQPEEESFDSWFDKVAP